MSSTLNAPQVGDILVMRLPEHVPPGREQQGLRPVLVVAEPERIGTPRFAVVFAAPLTSQLESWTKVDHDLYPILQEGVGGLLRTSAVLIEHARGIDATRTVRRLGRLTDDEYSPVRQLLERMFRFA